MMTITKTRSADISGQYTPTGVDADKGAADFRWTACLGRKNAITWKDGRAEIVTDRRLEQLQATHTWATDF